MWAYIALQIGALAGTIIGAIAIGAAFGVGLRWIWKWIQKIKWVQRIKQEIKQKK